MEYGSKMIIIAKQNVLLKSNAPNRLGLEL